MAGAAQPYNRGYKTWSGYYTGPNSVPNVGTYNSPSVNPNTEDGPGSANPATVPANDTDYTGWVWEEIVNTVLGLGLPHRADVTNGRWTRVEFNSDGEGNNLYYLMGVTWGPHNQDVLIFLNPDLLKAKNAWDVFYHGPMAMESITESPPSYTQVNIDPRTMIDAAYAMEDVQQFYATAASSIAAMAGELQGDGSQFKGQGGEAFYDLVSNLSTAVNAVYTQLIGPPTYANLIADAYNAACFFLAGIWNAYGNWTAQLAYSPLGAIINVLIDKNILVQSGNSWTVPGDPRYTEVGNLIAGDQSAWLTIEALAKNDWLTTVVTHLDGPAYVALGGLVGAYMNAVDDMAPIQSASLQPINAPTPNVNANANAAGPNISIATPNITYPNINYPNINYPNIKYPNAPSVNYPNISMPNAGPVPHANVGGMPNVGVPNVGVPNALGRQTTVPNVSLPNASGGPQNMPLTNLGQVPLNAPGGPQTNLGQVPLNAPGVPQTSLGKVPLNALGVPPTSPLSPLGSLGQVPQSSVSAPLNRALAADNALNSALNQALASGQVPKTGPLHNDLTKAAAQSRKLTSALDQALAGGSTPTGTALHKALADNTALNRDLRAALAKAPKTGPLHNLLEKALHDSGNVNKDLHQALADSGQGGLVSRPLENSSLVTPGQGLLGNKSLLSKLQQGPLQASAGAPAGAQLQGQGLAGPGAGGAAAPVSSGRFVSPAAAGAAPPGQAAGSQSGGVPFYPPMMGGGMGGMGGMGGGTGGSGERERTTWLAEDEDVWGTEPDVAPQVLGRDFSDEEEEPDGFDEFTEQPAKRARRAPTREGAPR